MNFKDFQEKLRETLNIKFDQAFGLDISDRSVEIIELNKVFRFSVLTYGRTELPNGVVENGNILDSNVLALKLKTLLKDARPKRVSTNKVIISLPESQVFVECFVLDVKLKSGDLNKAIIDKVSLLLTMDLDKMYWDFIQKPLPNQTQKLIIFVGVPKGVADSYVKFCNSIGLEVASLSLEALSLARAILKESDRQSLVIDIGARSTSLNFFDSNDKINMSVAIPLAGEHLTAAIKEKLQVEVEEAEALKIKAGFLDTPENNILPIMLPILKNILNETKAAIDYYELTFKQKLDDVYLLGGATLSPGLIPLIKKELNREVQPVISADNLNLNVLEHKTKDFPLYANVIGLGMLGASGEFKDINLLKKMPAGQVNTIDKLNLFKLGYLSKVNIFRMLLNNKYVLIIMVILIMVIFAVLLQQTKNFGLQDTGTVPVQTVFKKVVMPKVAPAMSTTSASKLPITIKK